MFKGHVAHLLRHPCGAAVVDDLYTQANAQQRSAMVAELYGREYVLFSSETKRLPDLLKELSPSQTRAVLRHMAQHAVPIMEKALLDPAIVHRSPHCPALLLLLPLCLSLFSYHGLPLLYNCCAETLHGIRHLHRPC